MRRDTTMGIWMAAITEAGGLGDAAALRDTLAEEAAERRRRRRARRVWRLWIPRCGRLDIVWRPASLPAVGSPCRS